MKRQGRDWTTEFKINFGEHGHCISNLSKYFTVTAVFIYTNNSHT